MKCTTKGVEKAFLKVVTINYTRFRHMLGKNSNTHSCNIFKVLLIKLVVLVPEWAGDDELCVELH